MIRDDATQRQVEAANPKASTWLSANAGSGKTRVLTDRVARLLLEDVSPQNILCLTYTKAAATEMQNRLFKRLGEWAMMPDAELRKALADLGVTRTIDGVQLRHARTLFARAVETPGGLKIQTIHSFCAGVLRRFPLEAQVSPQFREMEDHEAQLLRAEVVDAMLLGDDADTVRGMLAHFTGDDLSKLTAEIAQHRERFLGALDAGALRRTLGISENMSAEAFRDEVFDRPLLQEFAAICAKGSVSDVKVADRLQRLLTGSQSPHQVLAELESIFLTGKDAKSPFSAKVTAIPTKATREANPEICGAMADVMQRIEEIRPLRLGLYAFERTKALYDFATRFVPAYEARKLAMGALDFDDLIRKTKTLLTNRDLTAWVLFRLDGGIDHILVDEAQDTSPTQWAVIRQLTQEFAAGEGARADRERTVFVVGDKKQSIYSFQGADPDTFDDMRAYFEGAQQAIDQKLQVTSLDHSFRSAQAILFVVDACFTGDRAAGMDQNLSHIAFKDAMPGRVDLWKVIEKEEKPDDRIWYQPVDQLSAKDHNVVMAERVAAQIKWMIQNETIPEENGNSGTYHRRPITAGDFLILVQRRSTLFAEIIRACKQADLPIAGADRLRIGAELAVKDLAALLSFLALPEDDLSLAAALRSPLFGWSEQDLFTLAHHRAEGAYLWEAMRATDHPETDAIIADLRSKADFLRPYDLLERILIRHGGRQKLLARLGPEAEDGIDALLAQALAYESASVPSLTGFLSWMETDEVEIKRQMESKGDRIRVMTVHGAKGLEAPIVILPETAKRKREYKADILPADDQIIWKPRANESSADVDRFREKMLVKQDQERMRLLYVAMTRAEKWLIVGAAGEVGDGDESWYNIVTDGMAQRGPYDAPSGDLTVSRVSSGDWDGLPLQETEAEEVPTVAPPVFDEATTPDRRKTISPSDLGGAKVLAGETDETDTEAAKKRGTLIHRLLEHLPLAPAAGRQALGLQMAEGDAATVAMVCNLLEHPDLQWLWAEDALTEVDVTADIAGLGRMHGAIDRLIIGAEGVTAIDYKSNRLVPSGPDAIPEGLLRQMAVYDAALTLIFPDLPVSVAILWTETAELMRLPKSLLHETLNRISVS